MDILNVTPEQWYEKENDWLEVVQNENVWNKIPLLNVNDLHNFKDAQLVKFRGMVQDMHGPEFYLEKFEVINEETLESEMRIGKFIDIPDFKANETINFEGLNNVRNERQSLVVISVPGLNPWVKKVEESQFKMIPETVTSAQSLQKRPVEAMETDQREAANKKQCTDQSPKAEMPVHNSCSRDFLLNFPIPDSTGKVCHLKIYRSADLLKLNSVFEFLGFLSINPTLSSREGIEEQDDIEFQVHNPSPSLIPRIHCTFFKPLTHNNPLINNQVMTAEKMQYIKKELLILLTQILLGDELAAEYLIYHLISKVYLRKDFMAIGKFSLNISNIPKFENHDYVQEVYRFLESLTVKSHYIPMSLENMNTLTFIPKKDYSSERLTTSILQLSSNTHLVLDETKLSAGELNEGGINCVRAMSNAIKNQKSMYDFTYYKIEFDCDIPFLIMSEGKSMLPSDIHVPLEPEETHVKTFSEILEAAWHFLKLELLNEIRIYLTLARLTKYELTDRMQELVQTEFVKMRQKGTVSGDDLHSLLVLARLVCISQGKNSLDEGCWKKACELEEARKERLRKSTKSA